MSNRRNFFYYVIPSVLSFALSGIYAIVDGFFVGNSIGDAGLSAINIAYPITAVLVATGTGIGMGGAVKYSILNAGGHEERARDYAAEAIWMMLLFSVLLTGSFYVLSERLLSALGAYGELLVLGKEYTTVIILGTVLQVFGTGMVPFMRNYGGAMWAMIAMMCGFATNVILDYILVWVLNRGMTGAALATVMGQGVTLAPFGLTLAPEISLVIINRFSASYGGQRAIATYACISYVICIIYLLLQGVGDGSQPLMSQFYGAGQGKNLKEIKKLAYKSSMAIAVIGGILIYLLRGQIGVLFGSSPEVNGEIMMVMPIFLLSLPADAITRVTSAAFYATEKSVWSYVLILSEPVFTLVLVLILPPLFGGQIMIWWSSVAAKIVTAAEGIALSVFIKTQKGHEPQLSKEVY